MTFRREYYGLYKFEWEQLLSINKLWVVQVYQEQPLSISKLRVVQVLPRTTSFYQQIWVVHVWPRTTSSYQHDQQVMGFTCWARTTISINKYVLYMFDQEQPLPINMINKLWVVQLTYLNKRKDNLFLSRSYGLYKIWPKTSLTQTMMR